MSRGFWICFILGLVIGIVEADSSLNAKCRDLLTCSIQKGCVQLNFLVNSFQGANISAQLYNDLDKAIDYGCIFTSGCMEECNRCPLCQTSKEQLVDVLSGTKRELGGECALLVNCATDCIENSNGDLTRINYCLRQKCAFHCFDGSCPKCSAFVTRVFNQICVSGDFRNRVNKWQGHCYEMFRSVVYAKFENEFNKLGIQPAIGHRNG
ncbi:hypothetical protein FO519_006818 [Halicephalobus sp. NKZ332]|nr:hypothetical protein FO519_006818 [Halicephalobus sp. NKZ332]